MTLGTLSSMTESLLGFVRQQGRLDVLRLLRRAPEHHDAYILTGYEHLRLSLGDETTDIERDRGSLGEPDEQA
jgi:hypothetical protein